MMGWTLTRLQAALLGCGLAAASCLMTPASYCPLPQPETVKLPESLGPWKLLRRENLQQSELRILQATDHWRRTYQCCETGQIMTVTLVVGAGGPLTSHHPETCYSRNDFRSHSDARPWKVPTRSDRFRFQTFEPRQVERPALTIAYAWYDGDRWRAPEAPRFQLAGHAALQRLQVCLQHPCGMAREIQGAMQQFVQLAVNAADATAS